MNRRARIAVALAGFAVTGAAGLSLWRASRALEQARRETGSEARIRFSNSELRPLAHGVQHISAPAQFLGGVYFRGRLYAIAPGGLFADGVEYRSGDLLPPARLTAAATAITAQSAEPELWIGTAGEGMLAFDGARFRHLRPEDSRYRNVTCVLGLSAGRVLFGTAKAGVLAYDGRSLAHLHESLRSVSVTALSGDDTDLWIGTIDRGLLRWRGGQLSEIAGLPDRHVLSLASGPDGVVYAGTALGIAVLKNGTLERVIGEGVLANTLLVSGGRLYVGTLDAGLHDIPVVGGKPRFLETTAPVHGLFTTEGQPVAASAEGLFAIRGWTPILKPGNAVLADRNISALSMDGLGRLWVGYFDRGLDIVDADFTRARHLEDQHLFCINRIVQESRATTAVATANGLVLFDTAGQKRQVLGRDQGLIANHVTDVVSNGDNRIAATPAGLSFISQDGVRSLYAFHGLVNNHVYALGMANDRLLAGTLGGLSVLQSGHVRVSYTTSNSPLRQNWITAIATSGPNTFVGTYGAGVIKLASDGTWEAFADMPDSTEINPGALAATSSHVYAGTLGKGLLVYKQSGRRWHTVTKGLPSLNVTAVYASPKGVFVGTDNGLVWLP